MKTHIQHDHELPKHVLDMLRADFDRQEKVERSGTIHVSDLLFPRKSWMQRHHPKPLTDIECLYFIAGRAHHELVEKLLAKEKMNEYKLEWHGIVGTVDVMQDDTKPVEIKTTRAQSLYTLSNLPNHYLLQLGFYVAMANPGLKASEGKLLILYLNVKEPSTVGFRYLPKLMCYNIVYEDLDTLRGEMVFRKLLVEAPTAPPSQTCDAWLCRACKFYDPLGTGVGGCRGYGQDVTV